MYTTQAPYLSRCEVPRYMYVHMHADRIYSRGYEPTYRTITVYSMVSAQQMNLLHVTVEYVLT